MRPALHLERVWGIHARAIASKSSSFSNSWRDEIRSRFRNLVARANLDIRKREVVSKATEKISDLGERLNELTGYDKIEKLKSAVYARGQ
jgi:hypothetical protein